MDPVTIMQHSMMVTISGIVELALIVFAIASAIRCKQEECEE